MSRDPNVLIGGRVYGLTAILAIRPGCERAVRERIRDWRESPFARLPSTHFARLVVIDRLAFEGPEPLRPEISLQYLLFSATFDGDAASARDDYLEEMCRRMPEVVESVFGLCAGAPGANPARFREWIVANRLEVRAFFADRPKATVPDVRRALTVRRRMRRFAFRNAHRLPADLQRSFEDAFPR